MIRCPAKMLGDGGFCVGGEGERDVRPDGGCGEILGGKVRGDLGKEVMDFAQAGRRGV